LSLRRVAAGLALLVLAVCEARTLGRDELRRVSHAWERVESRMDGAGFDFDRAYGPFLYAADGAAAVGRDVAVAAPRTHEYYVYQAVYTLAPRRVTTAADRAECIAIYGRMTGSGEARGSRPIPGGSLDCPPAR
jgi:hypothetical protein